MFICVSAFIFKKHIQKTRLCENTDTRAAGFWFHVVADIIFEESATHFCEVPAIHFGVSNWLHFGSAGCCSFAPPGGFGFAHCLDPISSQAGCPFLLLLLSFKWPWPPCCIVPRRHASKRPATSDASNSQNVNGSRFVMQIQLWGHVGWRCGGVLACMSGFQLAALAGFIFEASRRSSFESARGPILGSPCGSNCRTPGDHFFAAWLARFLHRLAGPIWVRAR